MQVQITISGGGDVQNNGAVYFDGNEFWKFLVHSNQIRLKMQTWQVAEQVILQLRKVKTSEWKNNRKIMF